MAGIFQPDVFQPEVFQQEVVPESPPPSSSMTWTPDHGFRMAPYSFVEIIDGPGLILPDPPPRRPETISIGLFNRSNYPFETSDSPGWEGLTIPVNYVTGYVLNINHSALQPDGLDQDFPTNNNIDLAIEAADAGGLQLKVRVFFGGNCAPWLLNHNGGPIPLIEPQTGNPMPADLFWEQYNIDAKTAFWAQFAERYNQYMGLDGPLREVAIPNCMTKFAEEDIRQNAEGVTLGANRDLYELFGYTLTQDLDACRASIDAMLPLRCVAARANNAHQNGLNKQNVPGTTISLMDYARKTLGLYAALGNNSDRVAVGWPTLNMSQIYGAITNYGPPSYIQTAATARVGDLYATCLKAVSYGCTMIELPAGYTDTTVDTGMTPDEFDDINQGLAANALVIGYE